jgi:hypothetical protein
MVALRWLIERYTAPLLFRSVPGWGVLQLYFFYYLGRQVGG